MRPALAFLLLLAVLGLIDLGLLRQADARRQAWPVRMAPVQAAVAALGLTDLCLATEARYTRHPAVSDPLVPFMDHPGALEHFPTGAFWAVPPEPRREGDS